MRGGKLFGFYFSIILIIPAAIFLKRYAFVRGTARFFIFLWILWFSVTRQIATPWDIQNVPMVQFTGKGTIGAVIAKMPRRGRVLLKHCGLHTYNRSVLGMAQGSIPAASTIIILALPQQKCYKLLQKKGLYPNLGKSSFHFLN